MSELTAKDLLWFKLANANPPSGFYPFKDRFLRRFATPDGFDLQHIDKTCWTCDGSGQYMQDVECLSCDGSGIYDRAEHWLQRWDLAGTIYHKPMDHADVWHLHVYRYPEPRREIFGRVQKGLWKPHPLTPLWADICEAVPGPVARRAFCRLLLRHEPMTFYWLVVANIKDRCHWARVKLTWKLIKLRNRLDLFKSIPEDETIPF